MRELRLHAYLGTCAQTSMQKEALAFAQRVLRTQGDAHTRLMTGNHPDVLIVEPQGSAIKIDQIRAMLSAISMRSYEGERRAVILLQADLMTPQAQNCLLKTLEEPPEGTVFLLLSEQPMRLLDTVRSRCAQYPLLAQGNAASLLEGQSFLQAVRTSDSIVALSETLPQQRESCMALLCNVLEALDHQLHTAQPPAQAHACVRAIHTVEQALAMVKSNGSLKLCAQWLCIRIREDFA